MFKLVKRKQKKGAEVTETIANNANQKTTDKEASTSNDNTKKDTETVLRVIEEQKQQIGDLNFVLQSTGGGVQLIKETKKEISLQRAIIRELGIHLEKLREPSDQNVETNNNIAVISQLTNQVREVELLADSAKGSMDKFTTLMDESEQKNKNYKEEIARLSARIKQIENEIASKSGSSHKNAVNEFSEKISKLTQENEQLENELINAKLESKRLREDLQRLSIINLFDKDNDKINMLKVSYDRQLQELRTELQKAKMECEERIAALRALCERSQNSEVNETNEDTKN